MALIVYDGFDHYNNGSDFTQRTGTLQWAYQSYPNFVSPGRNGYGKLLNVGGTTVYGTLNVQLPTITLGVAVNFTNGTGNVYFYLNDVVSGASQLTLVFSPLTNLINIYRGNSFGGSVLLATGLNAIVANGWNFIEFHSTISATAGTLALRVNGQAIPSVPDQTGINTFNSNASSATVSAIVMQGDGGHTTYVDDLYICDGTTGPGSYPNNLFVGDSRCSTLFPDGNSSVTWTPLTGANWQEVSETAMDSDTSYNRTNTAGAQDSFNFNTLASDINQVIGIQVTVALRKEDAGARTVAPVLVIGGTTYQGTAVSVDTTYLYITSLWPINPHTSASWTAADVNGLQAGYVVVT